jgi:tripartite ATP-independent transporter DctP family solute receptor
MKNSNPWVKIGLVSLICMSSELIGTAASAAGNLTVKLATVAPMGTPWADTIEQLKKRIGKESDGRIKVKAYLGGQLGGEIEITQGIRRGRIEGGGVTAGALASVIPSLDVLEIPYLFESYEEADYILDNHLLEPFKKIFEDKGFILASWAENGWRNIGTKNRVIRKPEDVKGLKVRSQESKTHLAFWKKLGANPVPISVPETLPALQTGLVEGFDNTALMTLSAEWQTAIKHFSVTEHIYQPAAVVYSKTFWNKLSEEDRKILMGGGNSLAAESRLAVRAVGNELIGVLGKAGIKIENLTDAEKASFRKSMDGIAVEIVKQIGGDAQRIYDLILEGKKQFKAQKK